MKTLVIVGANSSQAHLARCSREAGYRTVVLYRKRTRNAMRYADVFRVVNIDDWEAVLEVARSEKADGIISNTDRLMPVVSYVAEKLGLTCNPLISVETILSKSSFREAQRRAGLYAPAHFTARNEKEFFDGLTTISYPLIVKPMMASCSKGVTRVDAFEETALRRAYRTCAGISRNGQVTVEEFVVMPSLVNVECDIFVYRGAILWDGFFTVTRSRANPLVPMTSAYPAVLTDEQFETAKASITRLVRELGITYGEFNVESYFTARGEYFVVEINPRQGGNSIPDCILNQCGVDMNRLLVTTAVGDSAYFDSLAGFRRNRNWLLRHYVFSHAEGTVLGVRISPECRGRITEIERHTGRWAAVGAASCNGDALARVRIEFDSEEDFLHDRDRMEELIVPVVVPRHWWHGILRAFAELVSAKNNLPFEGGRR